LEKTFKSASLKRVALRSGIQGPRFPRAAKPTPAVPAACLGMVIMASITDDAVG
jgi:hypothetical protein